MRRAGPLTSPGTSAFASTFSTRVMSTSRLGAGFADWVKAACSGLAADRTGGGVADEDPAEAEAEDEGDADDDGFDPVDAEGDEPVVPCDGEDVLPPADVLVLSSPPRVRSTMPTTTTRITTAPIARLRGVNAPPRPGPGWSSVDVMQSASREVVAPGELGCGGCRRGEV